MLLPLLLAWPDGGDLLKRREILAAAAATAGWSVPLGAQQKAAPVIGCLNLSIATGLFRSLAPELRRGLGEAGYVEGKNLTIEYRFADGHYDRLPALAADLVSRKVDLIMTLGGNFPALAVKGASRTTPIVFETGDDPVDGGLIASLARPGGNTTGVCNLFVELAPKLLDILLELVPQTRVIALLVNPGNYGAERAIKDGQEAASTKQVKLPILKAATASEIDAAFASLAQLQAGGLVIAADPLFAIQRQQLAMLAARHAIPTMYFFSQMVVAGGLISYGPNFASVYRQVGVYAGKILKGAKPADLPVEQPTKFELVVNLKAANALGLTIPPALLARADEVIE
jgi:putative tryptophan/tyrosine transport system substrate-binding protein